MVLASIAYPAIDPVALHLGPISVRWYGLAYLVGFVIAGFVMRWLVRRWEIALTDDDLLTIVLAGVVGVLVGGALVVGAWVRRDSRMPSDTVTATISRAMDPSCRPVIFSITTTACGPSATRPA